MPLNLFNRMSLAMPNIRTTATIFAGALLMAELARAATADDQTQEQLIGLYEKMGTALIQCAGQWVSLIGQYPNQGTIYPGSPDEICTVTGNGQHSGTVTNAAGDSMTWRPTP